MSTPAGHDEALALERAAVAELERDAGDAWARRDYATALRLADEADAARRHVAELEQAERDRQWHLAGRERARAAQRDRFL